MRIEVDKIFISELKQLFTILLDRGDEARLVGGCIRNSLLDLPINDYDIACKYEPLELIEILRKNNVEYYESGIKFGTITVIINEKKFEITSLREDRETDGRHARVEFTDKYEKDAQRRDFTFNALYCDINGEIYDYFNGIGDLKKGIIRFIGTAEKRIREDYLRILRFFRFYCYYSYAMDYPSLAACEKYAGEIDKLSKERVSAEFYKILACAYPTKILIIMQQLGILEHILRQKNLTFRSLDMFSALKNYLNFKWDYRFILALLMRENSINNLENTKLLLTKKDSVFINNILKYELNELTEFEIKKLLFLARDRELAKNVLILRICNNYENNYEYYVKYVELVDSLEIPVLKISGSILEKAGFDDKKLYSRLLSTAADIFMKSNFLASGEEIIAVLRNKIKKDDDKDSSNSQD